MNKLVGAVAAAAMFAMAGAASAEEVTGTVEGIDLESRVIVLDDGTVYTVDERVALQNLRPGAEVTVSYEESNGQKLAREIKVEQE